MIIEMALRLACTDRLRQLETNSESPVRGKGQAETQRMEEEWVWFCAVPALAHSRPGFASIGCLAGIILP